MTISPDFRWRPRLVVMVKEPVAGRVKTRLGQDIGMTTAAWWFRHQSASLLRRIANPQWQTILAVTPEKQGLTSQNWPQHLSRVPQGTGDIGQRMARIFLNLPPGPAIIIGADIPGVQTSHIAHAFKQLGSHDAVFGPATDGGFWLVGLKRTCATPPRLFQNVRWSSEHAMQDSIRSIPGLQIAIANELADVDTVEDLMSLKSLKI